MGEPKSRFWAGSDSSESESDGSFESDNYDEGGGAAVGNKQGVSGSKWQFMDQDSESEDEQTRVVKSAQSKAEEAFAAKLKEMRNSLKIKDWNRVSDCFQEFNNLLTKHSEVVKTEGIPKNYLSALKVLQTAIEELSKNMAEQKKLSKTNAKSFNALRGRMKKHMLQYQSQVDAHVEDEAEDSDSDDSSEDDSDSSSESSSSESESSGSESADAKPKSKWLDGSSDEEWDDTESSSSSSDSEAGNLTGRARWVKRVKVVDKEADKAKREKERLEKERKRKERREFKEEKVEVAETKKEEVFTPELLDKHVMMLIAARGKKGVNRADQVVQMRKLMIRSVPFGPKKLLPMLMHLITAQFDFKVKIDEHMPIDMWRQVCKDIFHVMRILQENEELRLGQVESDTVGAIKAILKKDESKIPSGRATDKGANKEIETEEKKDGAADDDNVVRVVGDLSVFVERLASEYEKSLRHIDQHSKEYIDRLSDESSLIKIAREVMEYLKRIDEHKKAARLALLCIEHIYYKHDSVALPLLKAQAVSDTFGAREFFHPASWLSSSSMDEEQKAETPEFTHPGAAISDLSAAVTVDEYDAHREMEDLCSFMYLHGDDRGRCRAMLCHIYHFSLHDKFYKARDLLLMSRLQDTIFNTEVETQILFNRMMVQLGLCAFRSGLIKECHSCLVDICSQSRAKELLAQGLAWRNSRYERNLEKEKAERRRLVPYHLHINLDLLECCHLVSAMLLEIPFQAKSEFDATNNVISKSFRRYLDNYARQVFTGPPENTRDHVMAAAHALKQGEWKRCSDLLLELSVWNLLPNPAKVKEMLQRKIKEEALRTYMLAYSSHYKSMKLDQLCELFGMKPNEVHAIISKMMIGDELQASWDQPTNSIILHKLEPSHLQALALQFADKVAQMVDSNERALGGGFEMNANSKDREKGFGNQGKSNKNFRNQGPRRSGWQHGYRPQYKNKANTSYRKNRIKSKYGTATVDS